MGHRRLKKSVKRKILIFCLIWFILFLAGGVLAYQRWPDPPVKELKAAGDALALARNANAEKYAPGLFKESSDLFQAAMKAWKLENERFFLNRDFKKSRALAVKAAETGLKAFDQASKKAKTIHHTTGVTLDELLKIVGRFESVYSPLPLPKALRESFNKAVLLLTEARHAREKSDFHLAETKLSVAETMLLNSEKKARKMLTDYFSAYQYWKKLVEESVAASARDGSELIVVDKMAHLCLVYSGGQLKYKFDAEFGPNWIGDKQHKGDQSTPEGKYKVIQKKERRWTIYYKALLLNYPNEEDRIRYRKNIASGKFPARTDLGGSIEIHGHGGRGFDWTNGCIALKNKDMDILFNISSGQTPVVIVGSVEPLEKYLGDAE